MKKLIWYPLWGCLLLASLLLASNCVSTASGQEAIQTENAEVKNADVKNEEANKVIEQIDSGMLAGFKLRPLGPALMSGRIADIAVNQQEPNTWYVAAGSGNLWKTENAGTTWQPVFDNFTSYSIGCVTLDPQNPDIVWVGTGEDVGGRHVGFGDGVYVSHNGGDSFSNVGLKTSEHIAKIWVHPQDSDTVLVAAQGPLWNEGGERGLYRTSDGGKNWTQVLAAGGWTGCTEIVADPQNPNVLYAALHQRHRTVAALLNTGPESAIHKSTDGGLTWNNLTEGLPSGDKGKIALAVSPQQPNIIYASIELANREGGTWRSENYGASWSKTSDFISGGTGPHYYQEMWADPHRFDCLYHANNSLSRSLDGGRTWEFIESGAKHSDNHAIAFHPSDPDFVLCGTDGGAYRSHDFAKTWQHVTNLSLTQFYKVDVDYDLPFYHVIGGTQDNSTQYGPSRTRVRSGIHNNDWIVPIGGDGHDNAINPENPDIIFCESQEGYIQRFDRRTGEAITVRPAPGKDEDEFRFNWDSPILISPHNANRVYFASNHVHRSDDNGDTWTTISPDLSRNENRLGMEIMGRVQGVDAGYDLYAMSQFGSITSISESPVVEGLLYAGTDDGLIHVSEDGGENWRKIEKIYNVPEKAFVNDIKADRHDPDTVYACLDDHKTGDFKSYLLCSKDRGKTWESIASDLPERHLVWRIEQDSVAPELLFLGTEFGLFVSLNAGENWVKMSGGMPTIPVRDLAIQKRENDLVCATFGRGFYVLDDYSPLRELVAAMKAADKSHLFAPRKTAWFKMTNVKPVGFLSDDYFTAPNPPTGSIFTVYVAEKLETARQQRRAKEAKAAKAGEDVDVPSFETLANETAEEAPRLAIEIRDGEGTVINRVSCPTSKGLYRVVWDMTEVTPITRSPSTMVAPGTYAAQLIRISKSGVEKLSDSVDVELEAIFQPTLPSVDREEAIEFAQQVASLLGRLRQVQNELSELQTELEGRKELVRSTAQDPAAFAESLTGGEAAEDLLQQLTSSIENLRESMQQAGLVWIK